MKLSHFAGACSAFCLLSTAGMAGDVQVNSAVPEVTGVSYQTIGAALTYIKTTAEPRNVNIVGGGPYLENISANFSVTIKGSGYRPVLAANPTVSLPNTNLNGNGVAFYTTSEFPGDQTFKLENMVILPQVGSAATRNAIRTNNNNSTSALTAVKMTVLLDNILVTGNNGSNQPISTDGMSTASLTGATSFGDDPMFFAGLVDVYTTNTIITNSARGSATADGIIFNPDAPGYTLNIGPGTVISYMNRTAIQLAGDGIINMSGTKANPVVIKGNFIASTRNSAISFFSDDGGSGTVGKWSNVVFVENNSRPVGVSIIGDNLTAHGLNADNLAFVNNLESAVLINDGLLRPWTFTKSTIVNTRPIANTTQFASVISIGEAVAGFNTASVSFVDSVIAGNGQPGNQNFAGNNLISITAPNMPVSFTNCALVGAGPYALATAKFSLGTGVSAPTETNTRTEDPLFALVSAEYTNANFLDVAQPAYDNAATGGADLSGYGDFVGGSKVDNWSIY